MESGASTSARSSWGVMTRQPSGFTSNLSEGCTPSSILPSLGEDASTRAFNPDQMCKGGSRFTVKKAPGCAISRDPLSITPHPLPLSPLRGARGPNMIIVTSTNNHNPATDNSATRQPDERTGNLINGG